MKWRNHSGRRREGGQVLLLTLLLLFTAGSAMVFTFYGPTANTNRAAHATANALAEAKAALIAYAVAAAARPGGLPCPDTDNDGSEDWAGTDCASTIGRLPWKTLGVADLRDASGARLWYALSVNFRDHAVVEPLNSDTVGQLSITGLAVTNNLLALVIAPGTALAGQVRGTVAQQNNVANYLEGENNNGDLVYTTALAGDSFNDRLLAISSDAVFRGVVARVAGEVRAALAQYRTANGYYPFANNYTAAAPYVCETNLQDGRIPLAIAAGCALADWTGQLPGWFAANNWNLLTHYGMDNACALAVAGATTTGCTVVIVSGRALGAQTHPCTDAANCVEDVENADGDTSYVKPSLSPASNDRMAVQCAAATPCL